MTKLTGFKVRIDAIIPIDKTDFGKQAAAFKLMDDITKTKTLPANFFDLAKLVDVSAKQGSAEVADEPPANDANKDDPANTPLTTDPLPEGAVVLEASDALDQTIIQTVRLVDGSEVMRRISAEQNAAELAALAPAPEGGRGKRK